MKKFILKLLGVNWEEIKKYNDFKQVESDIAEFNMLEAKIIDCFSERSYYNEKWMNGFLSVLRNYSEEGLPLKRYKELSNKYQLYDDGKYKAIKGEK